MKNGNWKKWLRLAVVFVCVIMALVLVMAEPNECNSMLSWMCVFIATKFGAVACGFIAYSQVEKLIENEKEK